MNKNTLLIAVTLALSLSWVGCNKSGKLNTKSEFKAPSGPVELKLKWPVGERIVQDMDIKQNMEMSIPGKPGPTKQDMDMGQEYGLTVLKETPDGGREVEMEFLTARMRIETGGQTLEYDSTKKSANGSANPGVAKVQKSLADMFGQIIGSKIQYFLDASNEVERMEGIDELESRLSSGAQADWLAPFKSAMFSKDRFKQIMSANRYLPPKAVQPGDTWPNTQSFEMGPLGTMTMDFNNTFQSWEMHGKRNCARLEFQGTIKTTPGTNANPTALNMTITDGDFSGISWFDPELGITIDTTLNEDIKMIMNMPVNSRGNAGAAGRMLTITNQMKQVITIKLVSVK
jgi:hypothetical protein